MLGVPSLWRRRRRTDTTEDVSSAGSDGVDDDTWQRVVNTVTAAYEGDLARHDRAYLEWPQLSITLQRRTEIYTRYLLACKIELLCDREPTAEKLHALAVDALPKANLLVRGNVWTYEEVFRRVLGRARPQDRLEGASIDILATAALGALLGPDPASELLALRPHLATYYELKGDWLRSVETGAEPSAHGDPTVGDN
jgi:hypothetical protein